MAERYGEIPKRFTKAWWGYFWMYYKWYVIGIGAAVLAIIFTVAQCAGRKNYDLIVNYCGSNYFSNEEIYSWEDALVPYTADANENGDVDVFVQQINFANNGASADIESAMQIKHDMELSNDCSFVFIYDKAESDLIFTRESAEQTYVNVEDWIDGSLDGYDVIYSTNGVPCAVSLAGSSLLESIGIDSSDMYISLRQNYSDDEVNSLAQKSAAEVANAMLAK